MKKIFIVEILVITLCFLLIGCNKTTIAEKEAIYKEKPIQKQAVIINNVDYSDCFNDISGCVVFYDAEKNQYNIFNDELIDEQVSPCSTFKIISTLSGLEHGIISSIHSKMGYDGTTYPIKAWNADLELQDAFKSSCVWYFKKVIEQIGLEQMQMDLKELSYGNCDISQWNGGNINPSPKLNGFWLESSLKISAKEQVDVLANIFEGNTNYAVDNINILKDIMFECNENGTSIYGKTGTGYSGNGWYIGFIEKDLQKKYFAVRLADKENSEASGLKAKEIALEIISKYYIN